MTTPATATIDIQTEHPSTTPEIFGEPRTYVSFALAGQAFATDVRNVREILDVQMITRLPNTTPDLLGMIDVRGEAIAVIDLGVRLGLMRDTMADDGRIIVFELGRGATVPIGVVADRVLGVVELGDADIEPTPETMTRWEGKTISGVARINGLLTMILSLDRLFCETETDPFDFT